jgi:hypothetical protein
MWEDWSSMNDSEIRIAISELDIFNQLDIAHAIIWNAKMDNTKWCKPCAVSKHNDNHCVSQCGGVH